MHGAVVIPYSSFFVRCTTRKVFNWWRELSRVPHNMLSREGVSSLLRSPIKRVDASLSVQRRSGSIADDIPFIGHFCSLLDAAPTPSTVSATAASFLSLSLPCSACSVAFAGAERPRRRQKWKRVALAAGRLRPRGGLLSVERDLHTGSLSVRFLPSAVDILEGLQLGGTQKEACLRGSTARLKDCREFVEVLETEEAIWREKIENGIFAVTNAGDGERTAGEGSMGGEHLPECVAAVVFVGNVESGIGARELAIVSKEVRLFTIHVFAISAFVHYLGDSFQRSSLDDNSQLYLTHLGAGHCLGGDSPSL